MAYAKHHSRKLLMQDKTTGIFHETPKNMETACNGQIKTTGFPLCNGKWMLWKKQFWEETNLTNWHYSITPAYLCINSNLALGLFMIGNHV